MNLNELTIKDAHKGLKAKEFSARELTDDCLVAIKEKNGKLNAYLTVFEESALAEARKTDEKIATVEKILKDLECDKKPQLYVLNKMDMVKDKEEILKKFTGLNPVAISALRKEGFQELKTAIKNKFYGTS